MEYVNEINQNIGKKNKIITVMYSQEKEDATQRKSLKGSGYRSAVERI